MIEGLYVSGSSMLPNMSKQDIIANNVANIDVPGFKRDGLFLKELGEARKKGSGGYPEWRINRVEGIYTDFEQGILRHTDNPLNFALHGDGFFTVQAPDGTERYTRNGSFTLNGDGILMNHLGMPVLGEGGQIVIGEGEFVIDQNGLVLMDGEELDIILLKDFERDVQGLYPLMKTENGLFVALPIAVERPLDPETRLLQRFLEESNVDPVLEMVNMIDSFRNYEADQRFIQIQDETLNKAVNTVGAIS